MKRITLTLFALAMLLSFAACNNAVDTEPSPTADDPVITQPLISPDGEFAVLKKLGLDGAIPEGYSNFRATLEDLENCYCDYTFNVPVVNHEAVDNQLFVNRLIEAIWAISDDGKAYVEDQQASSPGSVVWMDAGLYESALTPAAIPGICFRLNGNVMGLYLRDDKGDLADEHEYNIVITRHVSSFLG